MSLFSGSQVTTGAGTLTLGGNVILTASGTNSASTSGKLDLGSASPTFTVNDGAAAVDLDVSAAISGAVEPRPSASPC